MGLKESKAYADEYGEETSLLNDDDDEIDSSINIDYYEGSLGSLPYSIISEQSLAFDDPDLKRLIPHHPLLLSIQDTFMKERRCWYTIELEHGCFRWSLRRRFRDFLRLHNQLHVYRAFLSLQLPEIKLETDHERRRSSVVILTKKIPKVPAFLLTAQALSRRTDLVWKMAALEDYLKSLLKIPCFRDYHETLEFLEIGPFSFIEDLGCKGKEGFVKRRCNCGDTCFGLTCTAACGFRKKRWLFIKENFVGLINPSKGELECVMLLDKAFQTRAGKQWTGRSDILIIRNLNRKLVLQCESKRQAFDWAEELSFVVDRGSADFVSPNRYESFAPSRSLSECKWIVDGATYFEAVAIALEAAKEEIFIADWWLSPEIYLKRPTVHGHYWQLDYLLRRKAREGVKIYILLYKELEVALGINSYHTEQKLSKMHPNIQVLRHPYVSKGVLLWAHHEKIVCIDQTYAFVGGIDLCYGRWDDYQHRLTDIGDVEKKLEVKRHMSTFTRFSAEFEPVRKASSLPDEVTENIEINEDETEDVPETESFPEILERSKFKNVFRKYQALKLFEGIKKAMSQEILGREGTGEISPFLFDQPADHHRTVQEMALMHLGLELKFRLWHGKDYVNFISKDFQDLDQPYSDIVNRGITPRMPWHDVGVYIQGMVARDIARHFILRWNQAKVLRSLCFWSGNISDTESSIHKAYVNVIREAKKFIYIENQFFITQPGGSGNVFNGIADALFNRILKAHRERNDFRVYVVLPLLPAFEGEVGTGTGTLIQAITHWNYKSICRGTDSLKERLSSHMKDPSKYIGFYGLRTHGILGGKPVTELIYVHSKLLIADDQVAIIGSANINDRSLLGRRDSEIAVIVRDTNFLEEPYGAGQFCYSLRTALFREHLGLMKHTSSDVDLRDASSLDFYRNVWNKIAASNTKIYEEVFRCVPTDKVASFSDLKKYNLIADLASTDPEAAKEKLKEIQGFLVLFPLFFLCEERLTPHLRTMEHYLPSSLFT